MKSENIVAVVEFLYFGEANIYQENLDVFLNIAEELDLKGLSGEVGVEDLQKQPDHNSTIKSAISKNKTMYQTDIATKNKEIVSKSSLLLKCLFPFLRKSFLET